MKLPPQLPPTNRNTNPLYLATSPDGNLLKLLSIDGFMISMWLQLSMFPTGAGDVGGGWALATVIDIEDKLQSLYPEISVDVLVEFKESGSGNRSGDVVLLMLSIGFGRYVVLDLETKEMHKQERASLLLEIDLQSHIQTMKVIPS